MSNISMNGANGAKVTTDFVGKVSAPYYSPVITKGLVEFTVHPLQGGPLRHYAAKLVNVAGETYPVTVRATGRVHQPDLAAQPSWQAGDFLVRVDGIDFAQAQQMQTLTQEPVAEGTPFVGDIVDPAQISAKDGFIRMRLRPRPYVALSQSEAQLIDKSGNSFSITIRRVEPAPPSPTLGRFGDLIVFLEGITLEQALQMQTLVQKQNNLKEEKSNVAKDKLYVS